jgi:hypothetical protein
MPAKAKGKPKTKQFDADAIRRIAMTAIASDDVLVDRLVLKGGNALVLVHRVGRRSSFDLDYSIEGDFDEPKAIGNRLKAALEDRFDAAGYVVFDYEFRERPLIPEGDDENPTWGGYTATFKLLPRAEWDRLGDNLEKKRHTAVTTGDQQNRTYRIEISKHEYCQGKESADIDAFVCYVYTLAMIVAEKLRAICQQSPEYTLRRHPAPRPRDFYDIRTVLDERRVDLRTPNNVELLRRMFRAKEVPLELLERIPQSREFHRGGWDDVVQTARDTLKPFDYYFDFVVELARELHALGIEDPPLA